MDIAQWALMLTRLTIVSIQNQILSRSFYRFLLQIPRLCVGVIHRVSNNLLIVSHIGKETFLFFIRSLLDIVTTKTNIDSVDLIAILSLSNLRDAI